jgi:hypothetical protein
MFMIELVFFFVSFSRWEREKRLCLEGMHMI